MVNRSKKISAILSVLSLCVIVNVFKFSGENRDLSIAYENGGCFVLPAQEVGPDVKPIFTASYPGSGARMTWNLIEALTGLVTGDEWYSNGRVKDVVSVKTHYPHPTNGRLLDWADEVERAFLLFRNPMNAIPSFHNFIYENERQIQHHTERAPLDVWVHWRDRNFDTQINAWKDHFEYWMDNYAPDKRLVVPYEHLVDRIQGPAVAVELNTFLGEGPGVDPIDNDSAPCVWGTVVHYEDGPHNVPNTRSRLPQNMTFVGSYPIWPSSQREGPKERVYTKTQYENMIKIIEDLERKYAPEGGRFVAALNMYLNDINASMEALEEREANREEENKSDEQESHDGANDEESRNENHSLNDAEKEAIERIENADVEEAVQR